MSTVVSAQVTGAMQPIEVDGFVKRFGGTTAVNGISLVLQAGECLGLLGPNGAAKAR